MLQNGRVADWLLNFFVDRNGSSFSSWLGCRDARLFMYTRRMSRCSLVHVCEARVTMLALPVRFAIQQISNGPVAKPFASDSTWLGYHASTSKSQDSSNLEAHFHWSSQDSLPQVA